MTRWLSD